MRIKVMKMRDLKVKYSPQIFLDLSLMCYLCSNAVRLVIYRVSGNSDFSYNATYILIYVLLVMYMILARRWFVKESMIIVMIILTYFALTCIVHTEYHPLFFEESSIWRTDRIITQQVFVAASGITILPIVCLYTDSYDFVKCMTAVAFINALYVFALYITGNFTYLRSTITTGDYYSMSMGYNSLIPLFFMLHYTLDKDVMLIKRVICLLFSLIMLWMVIMSGIRGALLCVVIFVFMCLMFIIDYQFKTTARIGITAISLLLVYLCLNSSLLENIGLVLSKLGISSRSINALVDGAISNDNGRDVLYKKAISLISEAGPWGFGFCSSRYFFNGSYPHNILLELWIDLGYLGGTIVVIILILGTIKFLLEVRDHNWRFAFVALFSCALGKLFVSQSFWTETFFWETLSIGIVGYKYCHNSILSSREIFKIKQRQLSKL